MMQRLAMPAYYFHIRDQGELIEDPDGIELADLRAAREQCRRIIRGVLNESEWREEQIAGREFVVMDELGEIVLIVPFREATGF